MKRLIIISTKSILPGLPVVLAKDSANQLLLKKEGNEVNLNTLDTTSDNILPNMGSSIGNVIFLFENEFQIDPLLETNTEKGVTGFHEPEAAQDIDVTRTVLGTNEVLSYHFDDIRTARRFILKKILGEIYILRAVDGNHNVIFYPQLKEVYLFSSSIIEVGILGFLDCGSTLSAPSATITELSVEPTDKKIYNIQNTSAVLELPLYKKFRFDFSTSSGMNLIRMIRGKKALKDGAGNKYWNIQDEILKIYICRE